MSTPDHATIDENCAIVVGLQRQDTRYRGRPNPGEFRGTTTVVLDNGA